MSQRSRTHALLPVDLSFIPSTHVEGLATICNSRSRVSDGSGICRQVISNCIKKSSWANHKEQANDNTTSIVSASVPALRSCPSSPQWWTIIWKVKYTPLCKMILAKVFITATENKLGNSLTTHKSQHEYVPNTK